MLDQSDAFNRAHAARLMVPERKMPPLFRGDSQNVEVKLHLLYTSAFVGFQVFVIQIFFGCGDAQQTIPAEWVWKRKNLRSGCLGGFAIIVGCGGSQTTIPAIDRTGGAKTGSIENAASGKCCVSEGMSRRPDPFSHLDTVSDTFQSARSNPPGNRAARVFRPWIAPRQDALRVFLGDLVLRAQRGLPLRGRTVRPTWRPTIGG